MVLTSLTRCSIRLLRRPNSLLVNSRLCSSDTKPKSNMDFPNFTTKGKHSKDFEKFNKSPGIHTFASVLIYGVTNPGRIQEFDMQAHELIDGSLLAINAVSQIMAHEPNIEASEELKEFLTADCYDKIKSLLTENPKMMAKRELLDTPKDDVLLAYIEEHGIRDGAKKAKIVTMSFPLFSWLSERWQENLTLKDEFTKKMQEDIMAGKFDRESMKESMQQEPEGYTQIAPYFDHNVIIVANWDLVQKEGSDDWKIDGIAMRNLREIIAAPMYMRWSSRMRFAIVKKNMTFMKALRFDYFTDWAACFLIFNFILVGPLFR